MQLPAKNLLLPVILVFSMAARAQLISFSVTNQPLEKVFTLIEKQSDYKFIYSSELLAQSRPVTAKAENLPLIKALELCFTGQPLAWTINQKHIVISSKKETTMQTKRLLRGKVVDEEEKPVVGASVVVKNSKTGTTTDDAGEFQLEDIPGKCQLVVTGVQIETEQVEIHAQNTVTIRTRQKQSALDQTIVIAYGSGKRRHLLESVSKVKGSDIVKQPLGNPMAALTGRVPGLQITQGSGVPGSFVSILIRGRNSLANGNDPLIVVDGVPFPTSPINTSFLSAGITSSPLDNINPSTIESIEILKDAAATAIFGSRGANGVILITTKKGRAGKPEVTIQAYTGLGKITRSIDLLNTEDYLNMRREAFRNDGVAPTNANAPDLKLWDSTRYTDWQKLLIGNTAVISDLNASVSMGTATTKFLLGTGYRRESTVFAGDFYTEKISGMMNANHQSEDKKLDVSVSLSFLQNRSVLPREDLIGYIRTAPNAPAIFDDNGRLNWANSTWRNPWSAVMQNIVNVIETWQSNLQASYKILPGLEARLTGGFTSIGHGGRYASPLAALNPANAPIARAGFENRSIRTKIIEPQLSYSITKASKHNINLLLGSSLQMTDQAGITMQGTGYSSDELLNSITAAATIQVSTESDIKYRYAALFGRLGYDYEKRYLFSLSVRRDGSSRYGPANRFANFGALGLGWVFSSEKFMKAQQWLSFGKLRASAGTTGNDQIGDYQYLDLYRPSSYTYQGVTTFSPSRLFSPAFSWEQVRKWELGMDLAVLKNRINFSANYFYNRTTNQLVSYPLPATTGFTSVLRNIPAVITNRGWEMEMNADLLTRGDWKWQSSFNLTIPRNKLVSFEDLETSTYAEYFVVGESLTVVKLLEGEGVDPTTGLYRFRDIDKDGRISLPSDQTKIIRTQVNLFGGWENNISFRKFSLSIHLSFSQQPFSQNYLMAFQKPGSMENQPSWVTQRWTKPGDNARYQRYTAINNDANLAFNYYKLSEGAFSDGAFVRLRNLVLNYQIGAVRIFISAQNLYTWTRYKGLDPETANLLPPLRILTGGVHVKF
jgi:TonB-linked SusC/RagA family outer membrane protein